MSQLPEKKRDLQAMLDQANRDIATMLESLKSWKQEAARFREKWLKAENDACASRAKYRMMLRINWLLWAINIGLDVALILLVLRR